MLRSQDFFVQNHEKNMVPGPVPDPAAGRLLGMARGTRGPNILIDPHRACRQASGRVRRVLVLLVFAEILDGFVQIIVQLIQWRVTSLPPGTPRAQTHRTFDLHFCIVFRDDFLHGFFMYF